MTTTPTITPAAGETDAVPWAGHQQAEPALFLDPPAPTRHGRYSERRLAIIAGRTLLYGTLAVLLAAGLKSIVRSPTATTSPARAGTATVFPADAARVVASEFTAAYLTWPAGGTPEQWRQSLAPYLTPGLALGGGWDGTGSQTVTTVLPAGTDPTGPDTALITVAARLTSGAWLHLAVPISAHAGTVAVTGAPALVPGPAHPGRLAAPATTAVDNDSQAAAEATDTLAKFFAAYGAGDRSTLAYLTVPATPAPAGLGGAVTLAGVDGVSVAAGPGPVRAGLVTVRWALPGGGGVTEPYALRLERRDGRW